MKSKLLPIVLAIFLLSITYRHSVAQSQPSGMKIWFNHPADSWNDALPVGNGRLGAMIFGGIEKEHLELNEASVWTGEPRWVNYKSLSSILLTPCVQTHAGQPEKYME